jgi:predicted transcriptional regulator of viral defense system
MQKKNYLSPEEQILFTTIQTVDVITHDHIKELFPTYASQKINKLCHTLLSKGYLYPLKRGVYLINDIPSTQPLIKNPFLITPYISTGYLGFSSALRLYDLIDYESFTLFIVTTNKSQETQIGNYLFKTVAIGKKATGTTFFKNVYVSTIEKTIFDCFYKPQYAGGYRELVKALTNINKINWNQVLTYFTKFASDALHQRTGYILDLMHQQHLIHLPASLLQEFQKRIRNNTKLLPEGPPHGTYHKKWKLLDNLGETTILSEVKPL